MLKSVVLATLAVSTVLAIPVTLPQKRWAYAKYFDLQGHRGGRGEHIENTLDSFAWGIIDGVTSLEMDTGLTKDGHLVVWHDESIDPTKCLDTAPVFSNDSMYPYVGKYIANLTLAQVKTLDCGSLRLAGFPLQLTLPGTKISTLAEVFEFVDCATDDEILFNIESKVDGDFRNLTRGPDDFVEAMVTLYKSLGPSIIDRITHQWRSLIISKQVLPSLRTSALCDDTTLYKPLSVGQDGNLTTHGNGPSNWLAGIDIDSFNGSTVAERVVQAAASIGADFLSPVATAYASPVADPALPGYIAFTNKTMVDAAHRHGMQIKPWTPDTLNSIKYLLDIGVDGLITDFPLSVRRYLDQRGTYALAPLGDVARVQKCLAQHIQLTPSNRTI
ncbi:hypothetical protein QFC21_003953 [Naganishia friedmannii]|uniref:Uncharacterized protein n=1 Tax=Naganishia friedmannii TaxID=89922 RepID=A0ACC2VMD1_9TREE|nr:hypothetical protein QFC21_003953 [Naganishia friedmannii]